MPRSELPICCGDPHTRSQSFVTSDPCATAPAQRKCRSVEPISSAQRCFLADPEGYQAVLTKRLSQNLGANDSPERRPSPSVTPRGGSTHRHGSTPISATARWVNGTNARRFPDRSYVPDLDRETSKAGPPAAQRRLWARPAWVRFSPRAARKARVRVLPGAICAGEAGTRLLRAFFTHTSGEMGEDARSG